MIVSGLPWVAVKELKLSYPPIMENQMEKNMGNDTETGVILGLKEGKLSYHDMGIQ